MRFMEGAGLERTATETNRLKGDSRLSTKELFVHLFKSHFSLYAPREKVPFGKHKVLCNFMTLLWFQVQRNHPYTAPLEIFND